MSPFVQAVIGAAIALSVCALAVWKGERPEKLAGGVLAINWMASWAVQNEGPGPEYGIFAIDVLFLLFMLWLALSSGRLWAMFVAAFQLLIVLTHVSVIIDLRLGSFAFFSAYFLWSYLIVLALLVGTLQAMRRRRMAAPTG